jgi:hypothetical protein
MRHPLDGVINACASRAEAARAIVLELALRRLSLVTSGQFALHSGPFVHVVSIVRDGSRALFTIG